MTLHHQQVLLTIDLPDEWDGGTTLQVFTDFGSGTVDFASPLLARRAQVYPGRRRAAGYADAAWGDDSYGDFGAPLPPEEGFGEAEYGDAPYGDGERLMMLPVPIPPGYGTWKFTIRAFDEAGNQQGTISPTITAWISGTEPPPVRDFQLQGFAAGRATFSFTRLG